MLWINNFLENNIFVDKNLSINPYLVEENGLCLSQVYLRVNEHKETDQFRIHQCYILVPLSIRPVAYSEYYY